MVRIQGLHKRGINQPRGEDKDPVEPEQYVLLIHYSTNIITHIVEAPANEVNGGKPLTLAVFSCSRYQDGKFAAPYALLRTYIIIFLPGYFNAYGVAAHNTSADVFVHLGDYVGAYEQCSSSYSIMVALDI